MSFICSHGNVKSPDLRNTPVHTYCETMLNLSRTHILTAFCTVTLGLQWGCATPQKAEWTAPIVAEEYPLDSEPRKFSGTIKCPFVMLVDYEGTTIPYSKPVKINPFFRERLIQFEILAAEVGHRTMGSAPVKLHHMGTLNCRPVRNRKLLSEHAFANAIDVSGFTFQNSDGSSTYLNIERDWYGKGAPFFAELTRALSARPDIFRGVLGPGNPGHDDHLHLDMSPSRYIDVDIPR